MRKFHFSRVNASSAFLGSKFCLCSWFSPSEFNFPEKSRLFMQLDSADRGVTQSDQRDFGEVECGPEGSEEGAPWGPGSILHLLRYLHSQILWKHFTHENRRFRKVNLFA